MTYNFRWQVSALLSLIRHVYSDLVDVSNYKTTGIPKYKKHGKTNNEPILQKWNLLYHSYQSSWKIKILTHTALFCSIDVLHLLDLDFYNHAFKLAFISKQVRGKVLQYIKSGWKKMANFLKIWEYWLSMIKTRKKFWTTIVSSSILYTTHLWLTAEWGKPRGAEGGEVPPPRGV